MATALFPCPPSLASPSEESQTKQREVEKETMEEKEEATYRTKAIQFLGRTTPIILQNENGPCPLLAICNVLLLRNILNLNPDCSQVSQERLLSLVAERLIDSNSNIDNKDKEYVVNQQQNIADAIDRLERLATGIDVNIKFRRIDDFEFTPECAIFDLLDIPLYHGWIVDPQDVETANAIGCKSYNALMSELVALDLQNGVAPCDQNPADDSVDFVAATTAALGVPSPCLSKTRSFDDPPPATAELRKLRKGDLEEEAELLRALQLSEKEEPTLVLDAHGDPSNGLSVSVYSDENHTSEKNVFLNSQENLDDHASTHCGNVGKLGQSKSDDENALDNCGNKIDVGEEVCLRTLTTKSSADLDLDQLSSKKSGDETVGDGETEKISESTSVDVATSEALSMKTNLESTITDDNAGTLPKSEDAGTLDTDLSHRSQHDDVPSSFTSSEAAGEPMYEGEECVNSGAAICEEKEPVYEGELLLGGKAEKSAADPCSEGTAADGLTPAEGDLMKNFLESSASQLTFCGLFRLQEGLKECELCVFFRNNHFSTMFKHEGELYLLATDQGYMNQPDLVWEKLNEVNGDTVFMTGNFKVFKMDSGSGGTWNQQNAVSSTTDYLASINSASEAGLDINPDLQLAIALQQQEFEQQSPRSITPTRPAGIGASRLITGPQEPRSSEGASSLKPEGKSSKDTKCRLM